VFITAEFWAFTFLTLLAYNVTRDRWQNLVLLIASYLIYAYFDLRFVALLLIATLLTYWIAQHVELGAPHRGRWLASGVLFNLALLASFKYFAFFVPSILARLNQPVDAVALSLVLPVGLSFYCFRLLSYLFDVSRKRVPPIGLLDMAVFVAFFPQIASGPIERAANFLPSLRKTRRTSQRMLLSGLTLIAVGVFYKIAIADPLAQRTDAAFNSVVTLSSPNALAIMIFYSIRLYSDFAGYSAMAIGVSTWFGLPAMQNFRQPYFSQSITEFWTRWHISLSSWLRDYLFFPLSRYLAESFGSKQIFLIQLFSLFITMLATGIWHGSKLTFVVWGALHGFYMIGERLLGRIQPLTQQRGIWQTRVNILGNILVTQFAVAIGWVIFGSKSLADAQLFFSRLFSANFAVDTAWWISVFMAVFLVLVFDLLLMQAKNEVAAFWELKLHWRVVLLTVWLMVLVIFSDTNHTAFVYASF
jgi:D-alanyl-lipoteichoic acid acyltransferase DltB (MBOAT superfamily)